MNYRSEDACGVGMRILNDVPADRTPGLSGYMLGNKPQLEVVTLVRVPDADGTESIAGLVMFDGVPFFADSDDILWELDHNGPKKLVQAEMYSSRGPSGQRNNLWMCRLLNPCFAALPEAARGMDIPTLMEYLGPSFRLNPEARSRVCRLIDVGNIPKYLASLMGLYAYYRQDRPFPVSLELVLEDEPPAVNRAVRLSYVRRHTVGRNLLSSDPRSLPKGWLKVSIGELTS